MMPLMFAMSFPLLLLHRILMELCFHGVPSYLPDTALLDDSQGVTWLRFVVPYSICALEYYVCSRACDLIRAIVM